MCDNSNRCAPDECRQLDEGAAVPNPLKKRSQSLSSTILDYYTRYGQNRDLEKYFRYRKNNPCRSSSSDDSVFALPAAADIASGGAASQPTADRLQSAESLPDDRKPVGSQSARNKPSEQYEAAEIRQPSASARSAASRSENDLSDRSKRSSRKTKPSGGTSARSLYCLSSNIEINISNRENSASPEAVGQQRRNWLETSATQTHSSDSVATVIAEDPSLRSAQHSKTGKAVSFSAEQPIREVQPDAADGAEAGDLSMSNVCPPRPSSTNSSIVSQANKPRLEWDSLADVGYEKASQTEAQEQRRIGGEAEGGELEGGTSRLSPFERATLQKFFADRGLPFDELQLLSSLEKSEAGAEVLPQGDETLGTVEVAVAEEEEEMQPEEATLIEQPIECVESNEDISPKPKQKPAPPGPTNVDTAPTSISISLATTTASKSALSRLFANADAASTPIAASSATSRMPLPGPQRIQPMPVHEAEAQTSAEQRPIYANKEVQVQHSPERRSVATGRDSADRTGSASDASQIKKSLPSAKEVLPSPEHRIKNVGTVSDIVAPSSFQFLSAAEANANESPENNENIAPPSDLTEKPSKLYDSHTDEIIRTILCSTTSDQSSIAASSVEKSRTGGEPSEMMQDLQRGIELLDRLVDSERLNRATKKRLVKKIVNGLLRAKYNISSSSEMSCSQPDQSIVSALPPQKPVPAESPLATVASPRQPPPLAATRSSTLASSATGSSSKSMQWLQPLTRSELDFERRQRRDRERQKPPRPTATRESVRLQWVQQEIKHLVQLQTYLQQKQQRVKQSSGGSPGGDRRLYENAENYYCEVAGGGGPSQQQQQLLYSSSTATYASTQNSLDQRPTKSALKTTKSRSPAAADDSPPKYLRNRTKLRTPASVPDDEGQQQQQQVATAQDILNSYARSKQRAFLKQYRNRETAEATAEAVKAAATNAASAAAARDLIYANPYGEPRHIYQRQRERQPRLPHPLAVGSLSSSSRSGNTFLSSNSVSLPEMPSSSYPEEALSGGGGGREKQSAPAQRTATVAQTQTSVSLLSDRRPPATLPPISYTITFHSSAEAVSARAADSAPPAAQLQPLSVQEYLRAGRPRFMAAALRRRDCLRELNAMRQRRNRQREELFQQASIADAEAAEGADDCAAVAELCRRLRELAAPPPLSMRRCFATRELLAATRRRCRQLPEVQASEAAQRKRRERRAQRLMRDVFARELQKRALRGRVNLSNSVMVA